MTEPELTQIAQRHGVSAGAVAEVHAALASSGGSLAQFHHPELGGRGQWMPGMVQVGTMFDDALKARVAAICTEVAAKIQNATETRSSAIHARSTQVEMQGEPMEPMKPMTGMKPMAPMSPMKPMDAPEAWWPDGYGSPAAAGGQNDVRYAWFADKRRLLVDVAGYVATYDTADHKISGIAQSQGDGSHIVFSSQHGPIALESLRAVED